MTCHSATSAALCSAAFLVAHASPSNVPNCVWTVEINGTLDDQWQPVVSSANVVGTPH